MIVYKTKYLHEKKIQREYSSQLYDGINYKVYRSAQGQVVKHFQMGSVAELCELLKTLDLEACLAQQSDIFLGPLVYQLKDNFIWISYKLADSIPHLISANKLDLAQEQLEEQQLYQELVGDNEFEPDAQQYKGALLKNSEKLNLRQNLIQTLLKLYDLELQGYRLTNIKLNNVFFGQDHLVFMDQIFQSRNFEISLEEYLLNDFVKEKVQVNQVAQLARVYIQLFLWNDIKEQNAEDYLDQLLEIYGSKLHKLLKCMLSGVTQYFTFVVKSNEFQEFVSPFEQLQNKQLFQEFFDSQEIKKQKAWERIKQRFSEDQDTEAWVVGFKQNFQFLNPPKPKAEYRVEYNVQSLEVFKQAEVVTGLLIINTQINQEVRRCVLSITQSGKIQLYFKQEVVNEIQVSPSALRHALKFSSEGANYVGCVGDEGILYAFKISLICLRDAEPAFKIAFGKAPLLSLECWNRRLYVGSKEGTLFSLKDWQLERQAQGHQKGIRQIKSLAELIGTAGQDGVIKLWDAARLECKHILVGHQAEISVFTTSNNYLISFSNDKMMRVCEFRQSNYNFLFQFKFDHAITCALHFSGSIYLLGNTFGQVLLYDTALRKVLYESKQTANEITHLLWHSHSQNLLVSQSRDRVLKVLQLIQ